MRLRLLVWCCAVAPAVGLGCIYATGHVEGGQPLETGTTTVVLGTDGAAATTNNPAPECQPGGMYGGNTWTDLYQCYFGPTGPDSCAGQTGQAASCHGNSMAIGAMAAWLCGQTSQSCYQGMSGYSVIDPTADTSNPMGNGLYGVLCTTSGGGAMPLGCPTSAQLFPDDMKRIAAWIQSGGMEN